MWTFILLLIAVLGTWFITREEVDKQHFRELTWRDELINELRAEIVVLKAQNKN
jgi:hypothetical protein